MKKLWLDGCSNQISSNIHFCTNWATEANSRLPFDSLHVPYACTRATVPHSWLPSSSYTYISEFSSLEYLPLKLRYSGYQTGFGRSELTEMEQNRLEHRHQNRRKFRKLTERMQFHYSNPRDNNINRNFEITRKTENTIRHYSLTNVRFMKLQRLINWENCMSLLLFCLRIREATAKSWDLCWKNGLSPLPNKSIVRYRRMLLILTVFVKC